MNDRQRAARDLVHAVLTHGIDRFLDRTAHRVAHGQHAEIDAPGFESRHDLCRRDTGIQRVLRDSDLRHQLDCRALAVAAHDALIPDDHSRCDASARQAVEAGSIAKPSRSSLSSPRATARSQRAVSSAPPSEKKCGLTI